MWGQRLGLQLAFDSFKDYEVAELAIFSMTGMKVAPIPGQFTSPFHQTIWSDKADSFGSIQNFGSDGYIKT